MTQESSPALMTLILLGATGSVLVGVGYFKAVMDRANTDYKKSKAGLPGLRKAFWSAWWKAFKLGFWVFIGALILIAWVLHDLRE